MKITFKLFASLAPHLPAGALSNAAQIEVPDDLSLNDLIARYNVPREQAHLVLINGVFSPPDARDQGSILKSGDTVAIWPPVAGG